MEKITKSSDSILIDPNEPLILPDGTALIGRVEWFLYALCCLDYQNLPTPMSRIEEFANALITGEVPNIEPQSRAEQFFLAILDGNISDLPQPQSRSEVLLDKLARGEFDLSDVEPIQSRYELLLAYLIKNGGIGNIDYVLYEFSEAMKTMYNTVEKPFKSLELSGNTLVNCVLEDTENDDYTSFDKDYSGTSFAINGTSEGAIKSAILKGNTLVNLSEINKFSISGGGTKISTSLKMMKDNAFYTRIVYITKNTLTGVNVNNNVAQTIGLNTDNALFNIDRQIALNETGLVRKECINSGDLSSKSSASHIRVFSVNTGGVLEGYEIIVEGDYTNVDIPYFTGMQSVKVPVLTTVGKNLFDGELELGNISGSNGANQTTDKMIRTTYIKVSPNVNFTASIDGDYLIEKISEVDKNKSFVRNAPINMKVKTITLTDKTHFLRCVIRKTDSSTITVDEVKNSNLQLEISDRKTTYEPYKTNILTVNEDVELRGIGDVRDELNCLTGEVTERIGEIVLDGNQNFIAWGSYGFYISDSTLTSSSTVQCINNKYPSYTNATELSKATGNGIAVNNSRLYIKINEVTSVNEFVAYLKSNPITVQYQLATESVKTVDLNVVDQNNTKIDKMHVFNEVTHVNASSDELTPTVNIGKSVSYPTIIKPNTKYTVDLKRNDKSLTVDLGGTEVTFVDGETRKTITTPSTLTNDKLSYYGVGAKCNEIMLIEGEIERNIDYFTGMQSVVMQNQMPILSTVGKNLFDGKWEIGSIGNNNGLEAGGTSNVRSVNYINVKPNTAYVASSSQLQHANVVVWYAYDKNKNFIKSSSVTSVFTTPSNCEFIRVRTFDSDSTNMSLDCVLQIEQGSIATSYEPYKSSILSLPQEVVLRSLPNGVCDTLDTQTGIYTKRIGEISTDDVINNTTWIKADGLLTSNNIAFYYKENNIKTTSGGSEGLGVVVSDVLPYTNRDSLMQDIEGIATSNKNIIFKILKSKLPSSLSVDDFKRWLKANPITIQYELANPIIKTVDLNVVDQDGNTIPKIKSYKDVTHLEVTVPKQSLLPHISAEVATDNSKDMSSLTTKHQEISETQSATEDSIQSQSDEIDTALMATTEIFESILE